MCKIYSLRKVVFFSLLSFVVVQLALAQDIPVSPEEPQAPSEEPQRPAVVAFVNVNVVPMDRERVLKNQTVIVKAGHIVAVGPCGEVEIPEGTLRIDGKNKYLLPGLADMHLHIWKTDHLLLLEYWGRLPICYVDGTKGCQSRTETGEKEVNTRNR